MLTKMGRALDVPFADFVELSTNSDDGSTATAAQSPLGVLISRPGCPGS